MSQNLLWNNFVPVRQIPLNFSSNTFPIFQNFKFSFFLFFKIYQFYFISLKMWCRPRKCAFCRKKSFRDAAKYRREHWKTRFRNNAFFKIGNTSGYVVWRPKHCKGVAVSFYAYLLFSFVFCIKRYLKSQCRCILL